MFPRLWRSDIQVKGDLQLQVFDMSYRARADENTKALISGYVRAGDASIRAEWDLDSRDFCFWHLGSDGRACPVCSFPLESSSGAFVEYPPSSHFSLLFLRQPHIPTLTSASLSLHSLLHRQPSVLIFYLFYCHHCCLSSVSFCVPATPRHEPNLALIRIPGLSR